MTGEGDFRFGKGAQPMLHTDGVDERGIVRVVASGFWTPGEIDAHFDRLDRALEVARRVRPHVRVLVDQRNSGAQSPETAARIVQRVATSYREGDRIALVVSSSLAKMQLRRAVSNFQHEMFVSMTAAEQWLTAYD